ncbi:membrane protein implicated in regulation of membrane protease activity [Peribacillus sp. B2I2]
MVKGTLYFLGYFLLFPIIFMISFFLWRFVIKGNDLWMVLTDSLSILGLYYLFTSILFSFFVKRFKEKNEAFYK